MWKDLRCGDTQWMRELNRERKRKLGSHYVLRVTRRSELASLEDIISSFQNVSLFRGRGWTIVEEKHIEQLLLLNSFSQQQDTFLYHLLFSFFSRNKNKSVTIFNHLSPLTYLLIHLQLSLSLA